jgi:hypothetical protein
MVDFAGMLSRLAIRRGLDAGALAQAVGPAGTELSAVFEGAEPSAALLRRLAPALGLHASDLFLIAGVRPPEDLAPATGRSGVVSLVWSLVHIPQVGPRLQELVRTARHSEVQPSGKLEYEKWFMPSFGALLLRLFGNRNLSAVDAVKVLYMLTGFGPWSAATLWQVGKGRKKVPDDLVAASAVVLGISADDLAAMADRRPPGPVWSTASTASDAAALIWEARRIPPAQMAEVATQSHILQHEYDDMLPPSLVCHCRLFRGSRSTPPDR